MISAKTLALSALTVSIITGIGYLVYFDQKRQKNPQFKKKLRKLSKKSDAENAAKGSSVKLSAKELQQRVKELLEKQPLPKTDEEALKRSFVKHVTQGEVLSRQGEDSLLDSASEFYLAIQSHPAPMQVLAELQHVIPKPVFELVIELMAAEVRNRLEGYYESYPLKSMKVEIKVVDDDKRRGLFLREDVKRGDIVFSEEAVLSALEPQCPSGKFCEFCVFPLNPATSLKDETASGAFFCSLKCKNEAHERYLKFMNVQKFPAFADLLAYCQKTRSTFPWLLAKFILQMLHEEQEQVTSEKDAEFSTWDHLERLPFLELTMTEQNRTEMELVTKALHTVNANLEEFINEERFLVIKGRFLYNLISIPAFCMPNPAKESSEPLPKSFAQVAKEHASQPLITNEHVEGGVTSVEDPEKATVPAPVVPASNAETALTEANNASYADIAKNKAAVVEHVVLEPTPAATPTPAVESAHPVKSDTEKLDFTRDELVARGEVESNERVGVGLYILSSYVAHGGKPNCSFVFGDSRVSKVGSGSKLALVATRDLKKGEEIFASWLPASVSSNNAKKRYLAENWRL